MTSIEQAIVAHLNADDAVNATVHHRFRVPSKGFSLPYVTYFRISNVPEIEQAGDAGLSQSRFQVECWGDGPADAEGLFEAVTASLDIQNGFLGAGSAIVAVDRMRLENARDDWEDPSDGTQGGTARVTADFMVWHRT